MRKIESLHGMIHVERLEVPPKMVFAYITMGERESSDGVPTTKMNVEGFVRMEVLSSDLQDKIRSELSDLPDSDKLTLHSDTRKENEIIYWHIMDPKHANK